MNWLMKPILKIQSFYKGTYKLVDIEFEPYVLINVDGF